LFFIKTKHNEYLVVQTTIDPKDKFESIMSKWKKIATSMNVDSNNGGHKQNGLTCKDKCGTLYGDFKHMFDYMNGIGSNKDY